MTEQLLNYNCLLKVIVFNCSVKTTNHVLWYPHVVIKQQILCYICKQNFTKQCCFYIFIIEFGKWMCSCHIFLCVEHLVNTTHCVVSTQYSFVTWDSLAQHFFFVKLTISFLQWYIYIVVAELPQLVLGCKDSQVNLWTADVAFLWRAWASAKCGCCNFVMKLSLKRRKQMALVNYFSLHITALSTSVCWSITSLGSSPPSTPLWYMGPQANERPPH